MRYSYLPCLLAIGYIDKCTRVLTLTTDLKILKIIERFVGVGGVTADLHLG